VAALTTVALALSGCGRATFRPDAVLLQQVCTAEDLEREYIQQTSGSVLPANLAALSEDEGQRLAELEEAGLQSGYFVYWKEVVGQPPFPPPIEVLCQVLVFETTAHAERFVLELAPEPETIATTALTWLPDGVRSVVEVTEDDAALELAGISRMFHMEAEGLNMRVSLFAVATANGRFVHTTYMGSRNGTVSAEDAVRVQENVLARNLE
jgi:hypothetical protein